MREINLIVVHCSATRADRDFTENDLEVCHRHRGFNGAGYHFYIRKNGDIKNTRPLEKPEHMRWATMRTASVFVMKADWMSVIVPQIRVPNGRNTL